MRRRRDTTAMATNTSMAPLPRRVRGMKGRVEDEAGNVGPGRPGSKGRGRNRGRGARGGGEGHLEVEEEVVGCEEEEEVLAPVVRVLPEVLHGLVASYLCLKDILSFSATTHSLRSLLLGLITQIALRLPGVTTRAKGRVGDRGLRGMLLMMRRLQNLTVRDEWALRGLAEASLEGGAACCPGLLRLTCEDFKVSSETGEAMALALRGGALRRLEDLNALKVDAEPGAMVAVFSALGSGCCPRLVHLDLGRLLCREMSALASAMQDRSTVAGCAPLRHVWGLGIERNTAEMAEQLGRFLGCHAASRLETLVLLLGGLPLWAVTQYLEASDCRPDLTRLSLRAVRDCAAPGLTRLLELLGSGRAPGLRVLEVEGLEAEHDADDWLPAFLHWADTPGFARHVERVVLKSWTVTWEAASAVLHRLLPLRGRMRRVSINGPECWLDEARGEAAEALEAGLLLEVRLLGLYVTKPHDDAWRRILRALSAQRCPELQELYVVVMTEAVGDEPLALLAEALAGRDGAGGLAPQLTSLLVQHQWAGAAGVCSVVEALESATCPDLAMLTMAVTPAHPHEQQPLDACRLYATQVLQRQQRTDLHQPPAVLTWGMPAGEEA